MDDREVLPKSGWNGDAWDAFRGRRQRREKRERKMADSVAEFEAIRSVPGIDGVERFDLWNASPFHHSHKIQGGIGNSPGAVGKTDQGQQRPLRPDFGVNCTSGFEGWKRKNDVANRSRPNEQAAFNG